MERLVQFGTEKEVIKEVGVEHRANPETEPERRFDVHQYLVGELERRVLSAGISDCLRLRWLVFFQQTDLVLVRWFHRIIFKCLIEYCSK